MINRIPKFYAFDYLKGIVLTIALVTPITLGFQFDHTAEGFAFAIGTFYTFLPNTDGSSRHRFYAIIISLLLGLAITTLSFLTHELHIIAFYVFFTLGIFCVSMFSVYGFRASMLSLSGYFGFTMYFALAKSDLPLMEVLTLLTGGGLWYLLLAWFSHRIFENRNIALNLGNCIEETAEFLKIRYQLIWNNEHDPALQLEQKAAKLQIRINEKHELLRELLYEKRAADGQSNKTARYLLIFLEMLDIYELALAIAPDQTELEELLGEHFLTKTGPFKELSAEVIIHMYALAEALMEQKELPVGEFSDELIWRCENQIDNYIAEVTLPAARPGAFKLRHLLEYKTKQLQKVQSAKRIYQQMPEGYESILKRKDRNLFITSTDYSMDVIKEHLSIHSGVFRHSLRVTVVMLMGLLVGQFTNHQNAYWILLTIAVILRPNYGITKTRAINRIIGTLIGAGVSVFLIWITDLTLVYGIVSIISALIGFTFLQRNYKVAATFITIAVIMMYALLVDNALSILQFRVIDTLIGCALSFIGIWLLWPVWESDSIKSELAKSLVSTDFYLGEIDQLYHTKEPMDTSYRLARKKAFIDSGNLMAAFQRHTEEPKNHQENLSQIYAAVVLNQTFLNALAAMSVFIQNHATTPASAAYDTIIGSIRNDLRFAVASLNHENVVSEISSDLLHEANEQLDASLHQLEHERNQELAQGFTPITPEMRDKLQEGRMLNDHLKWLSGLAENIKEVANYLSLEKHA